LGGGRKSGGGLAKGFGRSSHPHGRSGGGRTTPMAKGVVQPPPKAQKKKKYGFWAWKRCIYIGSDDSTMWPLATPDEIQAVPRVCRIILAVYESDLWNPQWVLPYLIYCDHEHRQIVLAIRKLNLAKESDYKLLMNNRLGMQMFDDGYVHHMLLNSVVWPLD
jgi:hypothetical protein